MTVRPDADRQVRSAPDGAPALACPLRHTHAIHVQSPCGLALGKCVIFSYSRYQIGSVCLIMPGTCPGRELTDVFAGKGLEGWVCKAVGFPRKGLGRPGSGPGPDALPNRAVHEIRCHRRVVPGTGG
jgi:hypothetical protein